MEGGVNYDKGEVWNQLKWSNVCKGNIFFLILI
jgi:hypothetical protein